MPNYGIEWKGDFMSFTNRHLPRALHKRMGRLAVELNTSLEVVMNQAVEVGLGIMESEYFAGKLEGGGMGEL